MLKIRYLQTLDVGKLEWFTLDNQQTKFDIHTFYIDINTVTQLLWYKIHFCPTLFLCFREITMLIRSKCLVLVMSMCVTNHQKNWDNSPWREQTFANLKECTFLLHVCWMCIKFTLQPLFMYSKLIAVLKDSHT